MLTGLCARDLLLMSAWSIVLTYVEGENIPVGVSQNFDYIYVLKVFAVLLFCS